MRALPAVSGSDGPAVGGTVGRSVGPSVGDSNGGDADGSRGPTDRPTDRPTDSLTARPPDRRTDEPTIIAESPAMRRAVDLARRFASTGLPILLIGDTGTGKEVLAQAIHRWSGRPGELVDVDCGAFPPGMIEGELFGHERGSFTNAFSTRPGLIETAHRGTLFLDELASLPGKGQAALLRVLESGELRRVGDRRKQRVDIRLIAAVQQDPGATRGQGTIRMDLYHRLAGAAIHLPRLCERPEDLLPLARYMAESLGRRVSDSLGGMLERYGWPGNVRELRQVIHRAAALSLEQTLGATEIGEALDLGRPRNDQRGTVDGAGELLQERRQMLALCQRFQWKWESIAGEMQVSRATLYRRLRWLGIRLHRGAMSQQAQEILRRSEKK